MHECGEADASLQWSARILASKAFALALVVAELEASLHQLLHVHRFANYLANCQCLAGVDEVATAEVFRREVKLFGDFVHVSFQREDSLRRSETSEGAVWRMICRHCLAGNSHIGTEVGAGGMDGAAGEDNG